MHFKLFPWNQSGLLYRQEETNFCSELLIYSGEALPFDEHKASAGSCFGFVLEGDVTLLCSSGSFTLGHGMYFCVPGAFQLQGQGKVMLVRRCNWRGLFSLGGPIEQRGRLRYIDGCTDTLLIGPPLFGDACLNLLHFPGGIEQTMHTHPSLRCGVVAAGEGQCCTPDGNFPLQEGSLFVIPPQSQHAFRTKPEQQMRVIAYHPDSDCGPTHDNHPMLNRTLVDGISARHLEHIRTGKGGLLKY